MTRAVHLPTPGDPYLLGMWKYWAEKWLHQIDHLYIHLNTWIDQPVIDYIKRLFDGPNTTLILEQGWANHGPALTELVKITKEDLVLFLEDDFFLFDPRGVDHLFQLVESGQYDAVVSPRNSCSSALTEQTREVFHLPSYQIMPETMFWPCLYLGKKEDLFKTDLDFGAKTWLRGEKIEQLNWTVPEDLVCGDTFVWMSIQLRSLLKSFASFDQLRHHPDNSFGSIKINTLTPQNLYSTITWTHIGASSSGIGYALADEDGALLHQRSLKNGNPNRVTPVAPDPGLALDFARRSAFWTTCIANFPIPDDDPAAYFNDVYRRALDKFMKNCGMDQPQYSTFLYTLNFLLGDHVDKPRQIDPSQQSHFTRNRR